jgi:WD40 repeat protein
VGCNNGAVIIFNHVDKTQKVLQHVDAPPANGGNHSPNPNGSTQPVVDIQFDRLSVLYMLVAYTYFISLWDIESGTEIHVFDKQSLPITSIAWLDWTAGWC